MSEPGFITEASPARAGGRRRWQIAGYAVGVLLFGAAIFAVASQREVLLGAVSSVGGAPWWLIALGVVLPGLNWLVVSVSLWVLTRPYGRVGLGEMTALIANAWMLNYLPMRPGMAGRVTYHKLVNRIRVRDSAKVVIQAMAMTGVSIVLLGAMAVVLTDGAGLTAWLLALGSPVAVLGACGAVLGAGSFWGRMSLGMLCRHVDMMVWAGRYWVVFALIDAPVGLAGSVVLAVISQIALLAPFTGNGLGFREWLIGWFASRTAGIVPAGLVIGLDQEEMGLAADLVNRAGELVISVPTGLIAAWWLARRMARVGRDGGGEPATLEGSAGVSPGESPQSSPESGS